MDEPAQVFSVARSNEWAEFPELKRDNIGAVLLVESEQGFVSCAGTASPGDEDALASLEETRNAIVHPDLANDEMLDGNEAEPTSSAPTP